jgi:hypothetical protein
LTEFATFDTPPDPPEYVSSEVVLRIEPEALTESLPASLSEFDAGGGYLPAAVTEPIDYLRRNAGLKLLTPALAPPDAPAPRTRGRRADRRALACTVLDADLSGAEGLAIASLPKRRITSELLDKIEGAPAVRYFRPMPPRWPTAIVQAPDPTRNLQWGLRTIGWFDVERPDTSNVGVAVIDTGVDDKHPALKDLDLKYDYKGTTKRDLVGHGTHVLGTIAAAVDDDNGFVGLTRPRLAV